MNTEYEIKFLDFPENLRDIIKQDGGSLVFPKTLFKRVMFDNSEMKSKRAWLRLRDEGSRITLTYKQVVADGTIEGIKETEVVVDSFNRQKEILQEIGLTPRNYQENYREEWQIGGVKIDIDTWPKIGTYIEIEGESEESVVNTCKHLGLNYKNGIFDTSDVIFQNKTGVDMLTVDDLRFD